MNNFKVTALAIMMVLGATSIGLVSCQKDAQIVDVTNSVNPATANGGNTRSVDEEIDFNGATYLISNGMLNFTTFGHYEQFFNVEDPNNLNEFGEMVKSSQAMTSYNEIVNGEKEEDFIGNIVNEMGLIKIDAFTILLDFDAKMVYSTQHGTVRNLIGAKAGISSDLVFTFTMDEHEVIDELIELKTRGIGCSAPWAQSGKVDNINNPLKTSAPLSSKDATTANPNVNMYVEVCYAKYGIYFQLKSKYWPTLQVATNNVWPPYSFTTTASWKRRCGSNGSFGQTLGFNGATMYGVSPATVKCNVYSNMRALSSYTIKGQVYSSLSVPAGDFRKAELTK